MPATRKPAPGKKSQATGKRNVAKNPGVGKGGMRKQTHKPIQPPLHEINEVMPKVLGRMCNGESLRAICRDVDMPHIGTVLQWVSVHEDLRIQYQAALAIRADTQAEEIIEISDDGTNDYVEKAMRDGTVGVVLQAENIARSKLRVETRKWSMSRMNPAKYGDRNTTVLQGGDKPVEIATTTDLDMRSLARQLAFVLTQEAENQVEAIDHVPAK
jgi:hypothetical protein